jgi:TonB-dependent starch-binding outer membrane protein SusC
MVKKLTCLFSMMLLFVSMHGAMAQNGRIIGAVTDRATGETLPGASIIVEGTTTGTVTNVDGRYDLSVPAGNITVVASFLGYDASRRVITIQAGQTLTVNFDLYADITTLDEFIVIGYGTVKKSDATGSVTTVSAKDFNRGNITSAQDLLVGKSAGVVITSSGGAPGSGSSIRIRGGSSLRASNDPLIVIDGVPIDNSNVSGSANLLLFVNPNDIETFSVLKDASATAIYGSRASNGVIIITTKKGDTSKPFSMNYSVNTALAAPIAFMDVYSGDQIRQIAHEYKNIFGTDTYSRLGTENTNWQKEIFRSAVTHDHNLNFSGKVSMLPYRASVGYTDQEGILKNTDLKRITANVSLNPTFLNNSLKLNVNAKGMNTNHNFGDAGAVGSAINMSPAQAIMDGNESSAGYFQWSNYGANLGTANPVEQALAIDNKSVNNRFLGNVQVDYTLPFLPELRANLNVATDYNQSEGHNNRPLTSPSVLTAPRNGRLSDYSSTNTNNLLDFYMNYNKDLSSINSRIDATAGYSYQHFQVEGNSYTRAADSSRQNIDSTSYINENLLVSFFGRVNYSFMNKYLLTLTVRNDGSSRFAPENRWGLFPSAAFAWRINQEGFMSGFSKLSDLKLRMGWGVTGQQDVGSYYPYMASYRESSAGNFYYIDGEYIPTLRPDAYDPDIKWEETTTQNIGLDFGFMNDRITGSVDVYMRETTDLLNQVTIPTGSNFSNTLLTNVGSLENRGVELSLNMVPLSTRDQSLNIGFNFTYNENKITKLLLSDDPDYIGILYGDAFTGQNQVTRVGFPARSFFVNKQVYGADGRPIEGLYVDLSGKGGVVGADNDDKYIYKNPAPDYVLGFSTRYNYKNFDVSASARANIGNYVYNAVAAGASIDQMWQIGYWRNQTTLLEDTRFVKRQFTSDYFVENASFLKLDHFSMGYNFQNLINNSMNARVSFTVQNAFTISKYSGLDPEVNGGIDNNFYPRPRTFLVGLSLGF